MRDSDRREGIVDGLLYQIQFDGPLTGELAARTAARVIERPIFDLPIQVTVDTIRDKLARPEPVARLVTTIGTDAEVREFLAKVLNEIEDSRPWPPQPFRSLQSEHFAEFTNTAPIATIAAHYTTIEQKLARPFMPIDRKAVLVLELANDDVVAVVGDNWTPTRLVQGPAETLLYSDSGRPAADVIDSFRAATGLTTEDVRPTGTEDPT